MEVARQGTELLFGLARVGFTTLEQSLRYREAWERGRRSVRGKTEPEHSWWGCLPPTSLELL